MDDLFKTYEPYIDWSVYEGLSDEESDELEAKHFKKYGVNHILKVGAPVKAILAWKEDGKRNKEAFERGEILN